MLAFLAGCNQSAPIAIGAAVCFMLTLVCGLLLRVALALDRLVRIAIILHGVTGNLPPKPWVWRLG